MFHLAKPLEIDDDPSFTLSDVDEKLTAARKELEAVQQNAAATRDTHLEEMAKKRLKDRKGDLAAVIQNIKHCEEMKQAFQQMKPITKGMTGGVVSKLIVPNPEVLISPAMYNEVLDTLHFQHVQPFEVLDDQDEVMLVLVRRNKLHLHQAFDTPFTKRKLKDYIGEFGMSRGAQAILDGQFDPNNFENLPTVNYWIKNNI
eukprot:8385589-Ditylum_brightwellii.AAC.1